MNAIVESGSILTKMTQSATAEWMEFAQERVEKNLDQLGRLARCHTPHEFVSIQSELVRDNLQDWLDCARRMAKRSVRTAEQATIKITEQIGQAA
jgi:hypothetical protein